MLDPETLSVLAFWAEAGVDYALEDAPQDRLTPVFQAPAEALPAQIRPAPAVRPATAPDEGVPARALAAASAAAAADLEELAGAIAAFEGCALKAQGSTRAVVFRGNLRPRLLVVGEAPGAEEERGGRPFVGHAGKLLDQMLAAAGLLEDALITSAVFWRPPGDRTPHPEELSVCAPFLERIAALAAPQILLLVGSVAAQAVLGAEETMLKLRGRWREARLGAETSPVPTLATFHPAFLLRQPAQKKAAWGDLLEVRARLEALGPRAD